MIHSPIRFHTWKIIVRVIGWLLAVIVVHRRRAYFDLVIALLDALLYLLRRRRYPNVQKDFGF